MQRASGVALVGAALVLVAGAGYAAGTASRGSGGSGIALKG